MCFIDSENYCRLKVGTIVLLPSDIQMAAEPTAYQSIDSRCLVCYMYIVQCVYTCFCVIVCLFVVVDPDCHYGATGIT